MQMTDLINSKHSVVIGPWCERWRRRIDGPVEWTINRLCSVSKCKCLCSVVYTCDIAVPPARTLHVHHPGAEAQFLKPGEFLPHRHHYSSQMQPGWKLSRLPSSDSQVILWLKAPGCYAELRWMLLGVAVVKAVAMTTFSLGADVFFCFFFWGWQ